MTTAKMILDRVFTCFNEGRLQDVEQYFTPDVRFRDSTGQTGSSPWEVRQWLQGWRTAFPDGRLNILNAVDSGNLTACQTRGQGTHGGPLETSQGKMPATGKYVVMDTADFVRVTDGRIAEWTSYYNPMELMEQLGLNETLSPVSNGAKGLALAIVDAYNAGRFGDLERCIASDCEYTTNDDTTLIGPRQIRSYYEAWHTAFPDSKLSVEQVLGEGDYVFLQTHADGTHTGPLAGPQGNIPPTGKRVRDIAVRDVLEVKDGQVARWNSTYDQLGFLRQIGLVPMPNALSARAVYERLTKAFSTGNFADFEDCLGKDCELVETGGVTARGPKAITDIYRAWRVGFPDAAITLEQVVESGDCCAGFGTARGTNSGTLMTPEGNLPPTGRSAKVPVQDFVRVVDGKIVEWRSYYDQAAMQQQLGLGAGSGPEARNLAAVKVGYDAFLKGDISAVMANLTDDVDWSVEAAPGSKVPWHMSVHRREDVPKFFTALNESVNTTRFDVAEIVATGNTVAARIVFEGTVRKNGRKTSGESCQWFTFNDAGKIVRWHSYENTAADVEAWFSLSPSDYSAHTPH